MSDKSWRTNPEFIRLQLEHRPDERDLALFVHNHGLPPDNMHMIEKTQDHVTFHFRGGKLFYRVEIGWRGKWGPDEAFGYTEESAMLEGWNAWTGFNINSFQRQNDSCDGCFSVQRPDFQRWIECQLIDRPALMTAVLEALNAGAPHNIHVVGGGDTPADVLQVHFQSGVQTYSIAVDFHAVPAAQRGSLTDEDVARGGWNMWIAYTILAIRSLADDCDECRDLALERQMQALLN